MDAEVVVSKVWTNASAVMRAAVAVTLVVLLALGLSAVLTARRPRPAA
jgi:hypothetical protein